MHAAITCEDYSVTFRPLSISRYSFIQLSALGHHGENENAQTSKRLQKGGFKPGLSPLRVGNFTTELFLLKHSSQVIPLVHLFIFILKIVRVFHKSQGLLLMIVQM